MAFLNADVKITRNDGEVLSVCYNGGTQVVVLQTENGIELVEQYAEDMVQPGHYYKSYYYSHYSPMNDI